MDMPLVERLYQGERLLTSLKIAVEAEDQWPFMMTFPYTILQIGGLRLLGKVGARFRTSTRGEPRL